MNHHQRAIAVVRKSMDNILKGKTMSTDNLQPGCSDKDISDAGEAPMPTEAEINRFVDATFPGAYGHDVTSNHDGVIGLTVYTQVGWGDIER